MVEGPGSRAKCADIEVKDYVRNEAGVVLGTLNMWLASNMGMPADMAPQMIATIVQGEGAIVDGSANPIVGPVVHMMRSAAFGVTLAVLVSRVRSWPWQNAYTRPFEHTCGPPRTATT